MIERNGMSDSKKCPRCFEVVPTSDERCEACGQVLQRTFLDSEEHHGTSVQKSSSEQSKESQAHRPVSRPAIPTKLQIQRANSWKSWWSVLGLVAVVAVFFAVVVRLVWLGGESSMPGITHDSTGQPHTLDLTGRELTDEDRRQLEEFDGLRKLLADGSTITDDDLAAVADMQGLRWLYLKSTNISDKGLEYLEKIANLTRLHLYGTGVSDAGVKHLRSQKELRVLGLSKTQVTNSALRDLSQLNGLEVLGVARTSVSDAGLDYLRSLQNLEILDVRHTNVTDDGVKRFQSSHPNCKIKK